MKCITNVQQIVKSLRKIHNKILQLHSLFYDLLLRLFVDLLYNKLYNITCCIQHAVQQIERLQQIHNILTCQDIVQLVVRLVVQHIHNKSE